MFLVSALKKLFVSESDKNATITYESLMKEERVKPVLNDGLEVCFVIDATGSMGSYIDLVKKSIMQIATLVNEMADKSETRLGLVVYRDYCDGDKSMEMTDFVKIDEDNIKSNPILSHLKKIKCFGGGDCPEDIRGGFLKAVTEMNWTGRDRFIILVADAPCHGEKYHKTGGDSCPGEVIDHALWLMVKEEITLLGLEFLDSTKIMYDEFAKVYMEKGNSVFFDREDMNAVRGNSNEFFPLFSEKIYVGMKRCFDRREYQRVQQKKLE